MEKSKKKISLICGLHYIKLFYRTLLFILALIAYIVGKKQDSGELFLGYEKNAWIVTSIWAVCVVEMAFRFFPSKLESMGCQKQHKKNYKPTGEDTPTLPSWKRTLTMFLVYFAINGTLGVLYFTKIIDVGVLVLSSLLYGACDVVCVLFFCPFQLWIMKNKCCRDCRIYNWDFFMIFTPLAFIPSFYTWSLLTVSLILLLLWEIALKMHPERFSEKTNACISCVNCQEKLCHHKKKCTSLLTKLTPPIFKKHRN